MKNKTCKTCEIDCIINNTSKHDYGLFTDKVISIKQEGVTIFLGPEDLKELEKVVGAKFKL